MKKDGFILYMSDSIIETDADNIMKKYTGKAINGCSGSLKEITIPEEVIEIGRDAFRNKRGLKNVKLPNNLVSIGANAFASTGLEHIEIPASVSSMRIWKKLLFQKKIIFIVPLTEYYIIKISVF